MHGLAHIITYLFHVSCFMHAAQTADKRCIASYLGQYSDRIFQLKIMTYLYNYCDVLTKKDLLTMQHSV